MQNKTPENLEIETIYGTKSSNIQKDKIEITPRVDNEIPVIMSCDDNYIPYLGVTIKSMVEHSSPNHEYTVYILNQGLKEGAKKKLNTLQTENVKINYVDITQYILGIEHIFYLHEWFTIASYYRFFIPQLFCNFQKVIYCDCDAIFLDDIAELYKINIGNNILGAVRDTEVIMQVHSNKHDKYYEDYLELKNPYNYFQSGMLLMNISKMKEIDFTNLCVKKIQEIKTPRYVDQCIINSVCEGQVYFIDNKWNVENHIMVFNKNLRDNAPHETVLNYYTALENPKYLHFSGSVKPWHRPWTYNAEVFWEFARKTPFYEEIIYTNVIEKKTPKSYKNFLKKIFFLENQCHKSHKIITILGIKFKIRRKSAKKAPK